MSRVEVLIPAYNYGRYLRQSVESVLTQSYRDVSVLILDDCSTDETPRVAAELAAADPRVSCVRHPKNLGHLAVYNDGIDRASGEYMLLLSADDYLLPGAVERAVAAFAAFPQAGLVHGPWAAVRDDYAGEIAQFPPGPPKLEHPGRLLKKLAENNHIATAVAIVRRSEQQRLGHYRSDLPHTSDLEMWVRFAVHSSVVYVPQRQAVWRVHGSQMSKGYGPREDLEQCIAAFRPHEAAIRNWPRGQLLVSQIRGRLALRARRAARTLLRQGRLGAAVRVAAPALRDTLAAGAAQLRARLRGA